MPRAGADNYCSFTGNAVDDPSLSFTKDGMAVCNFRIAVNERKWDDAKREYVDGETLFISAVTFREYAEHVAESLRKGDRVNVVGRLRIRSYENRDGETRWVTEVIADEVNVNLRWAVAKPNKPVGAGAGAPPSSGGDAQAWDPEDVPF